MTPLVANLITSSGREELSLADRIGLLRADMEWLRRYCPTFESREDRRQTYRDFIFGPSGQTIHDVNCTLGYASMLVGIHERAVAQNITNHLPVRDGACSLSELECQILAWRRGGLREYKNVREQQRGRA